MTRQEKIDAELKNINDSIKRLQDMGVEILDIQEEHKIERVFYSDTYVTAYYEVLTVD